MRTPVNIGVIESAVFALMDAHTLKAPIAYNQLVERLLEDPTVAAVCPRDQNHARQLIGQVLDHSYRSNRWPSLVMKATICADEGWYNAPISTDEVSMRGVTLRILVEKVMQKIAGIEPQQIDCRELYAQLAGNPLISRLYPEPLDELAPEIERALLSLRDYRAVKFVRVFYPADWQGEPLFE